MTIYIDHQGGILLPKKLLTKLFPELHKKKSKRILGELTLNDMTQFTNYVESNLN